MTVIAIHIDHLKDAELYLLNQNVGYYKLDRIYNYWATNFYQELSIMSQKHATYLILKYNAFNRDKEYPLE